jgi:predicted homoserine dehydrogenase-like protein
MYDIILKQLEKRSKPIDIIMVGLGFMGFGFLSYAQHVKGIRIPLVISRRPDESRAFLEEKGLKAIVSSDLGKIKDYANKGYICISDDLDLIKRFENNIIFEVTGTVDYASEAAIKTIQARKHLITMNPELQSTVGSELKVLADSKNAVITDVIGDQPGSLARLIYKAKLMGFKVRMAGNMKRYLDLHATQEKMAPWAKDKGLAVRQTTSFTDGTKQAIEMNLVGNYFGMKVLQRGMAGPNVNDIKEVITKFDWDKIPEEGIVDYVIGKNLFPGVFLVAEHKDSHQQKYLRYLGLGEGPLYVLFEPYHLCHLEIIETIAKVALFGEPTINNTTSPILKTNAFAKRDLQKGEKLDGIGGDTVYGVVHNIEDCKDFLPVGLAGNCIVKTDIPKDLPVKISDVILPLNTATILSGLVKRSQKSSFLGSIFKSVNLF